MELTLQPHEASLLHEILSNFLPELRMEISNTENYDFREELKQQEEIVKSLIARLEQGASQST